MIELLPLEKDRYHDWNSVVENSKNGVFLIHTDYFKYHEDRFNDKSLIAYKKNKPVAVFPANEIDGVIYSHSGLTYGGLIYGTALHAKDVLDLFSAIKEFFVEQGYKKITYKCIPSVFKKYPSDEDLYALFVNNAELTRRDLSSVISLQERPKFSDSRKNVIRKAAKNDVAINVSDDFRAFHTLLSEVLSKFGAKPVHSVDELELLASKFEKNIKLYTAVKSEELIAGCLIYDFGHIVHTQYLSSNSEGRRCGALDYILGHLIENVYSDREYFSFGISTENAGTFLNEGLIAQKEGFGGRGIVHDFYDWDLSK
ncbi:GNAT family N-acetyltransferase [Pectobacterium sp. 1950-15]|uniref:GNAT family N-acetyltransferase n=1 Tax=Pectobacterium sp. 1950-15 TaxID=3128982 RepID=UPI0030165203